MDSCPHCEYEHEEYEMIEKHMKKHHGRHHEHDVFNMNHDWGLGLKGSVL